MEVVAGGGEHGVDGVASTVSQTALREWAYAQAYQNSDQRSAELLTWLHPYIGRH
jgi:hypothetical protein